MFTFRVLPVTTEPGRSYLDWSREFKITDDAAPEISRARSRRRRRRARAGGAFSRMRSVLFG